MLISVLGESLRAAPSALVVDVGLGDRPDTTLELALALRSEGLHNPVLGVDADSERVRAARAGEPLEGVRFVHADLRELGEHCAGALVVRTANVLRQAPLRAVPALHEALIGVLRPGGWVLEGSTDLSGDIGAFHLLRRGPTLAVNREALAFVTSFQGGFAPLRFRDHLPRDLRHGVRPDTQLAGFFSQWTAAFSRARASGCKDAAGLFRQSVLDCPDLHLLPLADGGLGALWRPADGVLPDGC